ncbi:MFS transporter [Biscogniauxia mediterranea]|nr:MFS transporter [Biscogniauxia mediterranea]
MSGSTTASVNSPSDAKGQRAGETLGKIQLRDHETNDIILVPEPSNDPNDPLNWSPTQKYYIFALTCAGVFFEHCVLVGPSVVLEQVTVEYFGSAPGSVVANLSKTSYFQTAPSLLIGLSNFIWVPLAIKFGRRPVYIASYLLLTATCIWCALATSFESALAGRILLGFAGGAAELVAPLILTDLFFLHERGKCMVIYTCALSAGVGGGVVFSGLIVKTYPWQVVYWLFTACVGFVTFLVLFTFPETQYRRQLLIIDSGDSTTKLEDSKSSTGPYNPTQVEAVGSQNSLPPKRTFLQNMRVFSGVYTSETLPSMMFRPIMAIILPAVLWASLVNSVTIGMIVVLSANFSTAFSTIYGFQPWQSGLTYISTIVGSLVAILCGGHFTDWVADKLTIRNGGLRTPEMRLPAIIISLITGPLACVLYGVGFGKELHWMVAVIGIGLVNFTTVQSNNISLVYILDSYRPIAGEVVVTQSAFKALFGFLISFYVNDWIMQSGYITVFGILAGVSAAVFLSTAIFYYWGGQIRESSWKWGFAKRFLHWDVDREVGE